MRTSLAAVESELWALEENLLDHLAPPPGMVKVPGGGYVDVRARKRGADGEADEPPLPRELSVRERAILLASGAATPGSGLQAATMRLRRKALLETRDGLRHALGARWNREGRGDAAGAGADGRPGLGGEAGGKGAKRRRLGADAGAEAGADADGSPRSGEPPPRGGRVGRSSSSARAPPAPLVETERDALIRKGLLTPFAALEGFERRKEAPRAAQEGTSGFAPGRASRGPSLSPPAPLNEVDMFRGAAPSPLPPPPPPPPAASLSSRAGGSPAAGASHLTAADLETPGSGDRPSGCSPLEALAARGAARRLHGAQLARSGTAFLTPDQAPARERPAMRMHEGFWRAAAAAQVPGRERGDEIAGSRPAPRAAGRSRRGAGRGAGGEEAEEEGEGEGEGSGRRAVAARSTGRLQALVAAHEREEGRGASGDRDGEGRGGAAGPETVPRPSSASVGGHGGGGSGSAAGAGGGGSPHGSSPGGARADERRRVRRAAALAAERRAARIREDVRRKVHDTGGVGAGSPGAGPDDDASARGAGSPSSSRSASPSRLGPERSSSSSSSSSSSGEEIFFEADEVFERDDYDLGAYERRLEAAGKLLRHRVQARRRRRLRRRARRERAAGGTRRDGSGRGVGNDGSGNADAIGAARGVGDGADRVARNDAQSDAPVRPASPHPPPPSSPVASSTSSSDACFEGGFAVPSQVFASLYPHQRTAVKWMWELYAQGAGGVVGDEMGLGKTIQIAAFLAGLHASGLYRPSVVVCPTTLVHQWGRELRRWCPPLRVVVLSGGWKAAHAEWIDDPDATGGGEGGTRGRGGRGNARRSRTHIADWDEEEDEEEEEEEEEEGEEEEEDEEEEEEDYEENENEEDEEDEEEANALGSSTSLEVKGGGNRGSNDSNGLNAWGTSSMNDEDEEIEDVEAALTGRAISLGLRPPRPGTAATSQRRPLRVDSTLQEGKGPASARGNTRSNAQTGAQTGVQTGAQTARPRSRTRSTRSRSAQPPPPFPFPSSSPPASASSPSLPAPSSSSSSSSRARARVRAAYSDANGLLLTTYDALRRDAGGLLSRRWGVAVLDEGHRLRSPDAAVTLAAKCLKTPHRLLLTGSPIQNRLDELWSLMDFVFPGRLGSLPTFRAAIAQPIAAGGWAGAGPVAAAASHRCAVLLRDLVAPYLLRRRKKDVRIELPDRVEKTLFCRLAPEQRAAYRSFLASRDARDALAGRISPLAAIDALRKMCNHPDLVNASLKAHERQRILAKPGDERPEAGRDGRVETGEGERVAPPSSPPRPSSPSPSSPPPHALIYGDPVRSGKLQVLLRLLEAWRAHGHRALVFAQTRQTLDILERAVSRHANPPLPYVRMDGATPPSERPAKVDAFSAPGSRAFCFLLTTRVGGLGLNLTAADRVAIFDPDWNAATDAQARERAWRIGQGRRVVIYRLLTAGTVEEKMYHRQIYKQHLSDRILRDPRQRRFFKSRDIADLFTLGDEADAGDETRTIFAGVGKEQLAATRGRKEEGEGNDTERANGTVATTTTAATTTPNGSTAPVPDANAAASDAATATAPAPPPGSSTSTSATMTPPPPPLPQSSSGGGAVVSAAMDADEVYRIAEGAPEDGRRRNGADERALPGRPAWETAERGTAPAVSASSAQNARTPERGADPARSSPAPASETPTPASTAGHAANEPSSPSSPSLPASETALLRSLLDSHSALASTLDHKAIEEANEAVSRAAEREAARIARKAVEMLRASRRDRAGAPVSEPTWTGRSGTAGAVAADEREAARARAPRAGASPTVLAAHRAQRIESYLRSRPGYRATTAQIAEACGSDVRQGSDAAAFRAVLRSVATLQPGGGRGARLWVLKR